MKLNLQLTTEEAKMATATVTDCSKSGSQYFDVMLIGLDTVEKVFALSVSLKNYNIKYGCRFTKAASSAS